MPNTFTSAADLNHVHVGVAGSDPAADNLEAGSEHVEGRGNDPLVTQPRTPSPRCTVGLHFAPERAIAGSIIDVLQHRNGGQIVGRDVIVPVLARPESSRAAFSFARIRPVRRQADDRRKLAGPPRIIGSTREPHGAPFGSDQFETIADRRGCPNVLSASRSAAVKGRLVMGKIPGRGLSN